MIGVAAGSHCACAFTPALALFVSDVEVRGQRNEYGEPLCFGYQYDGSVLAVLCVCVYVCHYG